MIEGTLSSDTIQQLNKLERHHNVSIYLTDIKNQTHWGIHEDRLFNPASTLKVPIAIASLLLLNEHNNSWQETINVTQSDIQTGSGIIKKQQLPKAYTIKKLLELMISKSDNTATTLLINHFGIKNINNEFKKAGLFNTTLTNKNFLDYSTQNKITARDLNNTYLHLLKNPKIKAFQKNFILIR